MCVAAATMFAAGCPARRAMSPDKDLPVGEVPDLGAPDACGSYDANALMRCVSPKHIEADARLIAHERPPGSAHHGAVRETCRARFDALGYETRLVDYGSGINVIGQKPGFSKPEQVVVIGAHYDQLAGCPGANDNASGVAALFESARVLATARFDRTLVVACWDEGERGQLGSAAHAEEAEAGGVKIQLAVSFESLGFYSSEESSQRVPEGFEQLFPDQALALLDNDHRGDFLTVVAEPATEAWAERVLRHGKDDQLSVHVLTLTDRMKVKQRSLHRSDHASFWDHGFAAMLLTDTGPFRNERVGCAKGQDEIATVDFTFTARATRAGIGAIAEVLEIR